MLPSVHCSFLLIAPSHARTPPTFVPSHMYLLTLIWIPTTLAMFPSCKSPGTSFFNWFALFCQHRAPVQCSLFHSREWVISPPTSLSWPQSSVLLKYMARLHTCPPFCVAHPTETLHSNAHDFFFLKPGQLLSVHHYRQILDAKEKRKRKRQWKTMTRATSQSV